MTDPAHQVLHAAADGSRVGAMISFSLAHEDLEDSSEWEIEFHEKRRRSSEKPFPHIDDIVLCARLLAN